MSRKKNLKEQLKNVSNEINIKKKAIDVY